MSREPGAKRRVDGPEEPELVDVVLELDQAKHADDARDQPLLRIVQVRFFYENLSDRAQAISPFLRAVATSCYFVCNVSLVALAIQLDSRRRFIETWVESARWAAVSNYLAFPLAILLGWAIRSIGTYALALGIPPAWMLFTF